MASNNAGQDKNVAEKTNTLTLKVKTAADLDASRIRAGRIKAEADI